MTTGEEPRFLDLPTVPWLHRRSLELFGGMDGVRDVGAIESALAAAQNAWLYRDADAFEIAATYAFHLAESQASLDGNKRTAVACARTFLKSNEIHAAPNQDDLYDAMIAIGERRMDKAALAAVRRKQFPKT